MARRIRPPLDFPIVEIFGYPVTAQTPDAIAARKHQLCPFAENECEKQRQYRYGYYSVTYAAEADKGERKTYAVCDHRLDGPPIRAVLNDYFATVDFSVRIASEVVLKEPRISFDYVAFKETNNGIDDVVAIETQAIDLRGGGVGPAFRAWQDGQPNEWRRYFTEEAVAGGRKDKIAYGVNMGNIYKRLGLSPPISFGLRPLTAGHLTW